MANDLMRAIPLVEWDSQEEARASGLTLMALPWVLSLDHEQDVLNGKVLSYSTEVCLKLVACSITMIHHWRHSTFVRSNRVRRENVYHIRFVRGRLQPASGWDARNCNGNRTTQMFNLIRSDLVMNLTN
nr:hypothetical protein Iba_chr02aCG19800 [Ipomoea batatas]